jgi:hypothetical protein
MKIAVARIRGRTFFIELGCEITSDIFLDLDFSAIGIFMVVMQKFPRDTDCIEYEL